MRCFPTKRIITETLQVHWPCFSDMVSVANGAMVPVDGSNQNTELSEPQAPLQTLWVLKIAGLLSGTEGPDCFVDTEISPQPSKGKHIPSRDCERVLPEGLV